MSDYITKALLSGLGLASLTKDAIQQMGKDLAKRANLSEKEGRRLVKDLERRSNQASQALEEKVNTAVHKVVKRLKLATRADVHKAARKGRKSGRRAGRSGGRSSGGAASGS